MLIIIGLVVGILSGMALGGGILLVPSLIYLVGTEQHIAQGVSLATFIPTSIVAIVTHANQGNVDFKLALHIIVGSILGALIGSSIASILSPNILRRIFGIFLIVIGFYEILAKPKLKKHVLEDK